MLYIRSRKWADTLQATKSMCGAGPLGKWRQKSQIAPSLRVLGRAIFVGLWALALCLPMQAANSEEADNANQALSADVESLKKSALQLNRDLLILEEELLFPANTQITVFLSLDVGEYFALDAVKLSIDDKLVASHLYTERQHDALKRGGIQRLYIGNLKTGSHTLSAIFTGYGPENREYKRGATITVDKDDDPKMLELRIMDKTSKMQPDFEFKEWQL